MNKYLTKEELGLLIKTNKIKNDEVHAYLFDDFIIKYGANHDINTEDLYQVRKNVHSAFYNALRFYSSFKENEKFELLTNMLVDEFENNNFKVEWYSHDFWVLFSFKEMGCAYKDWMLGNLGYITTKEDRLSGVNFLKKAPEGNFNKYEELTKFLLKFNPKHTEILVYWLTLANKVENKKKLAKESANNTYKFLEAFESAEKETMLIRKIEAISLFKKDPDLLMGKLKTELDSYYVKKYPNVMEFIVNKIKDLGGEVEMPVYEIFPKNSEEIIYTVNKKISVKGMVANKLAAQKTAEKLMELLYGYLKITFENKGISFNRSDDTAWEKSLNCFEPVVVFSASSEYDFRINEMKSIINETLDIGINYLLKHNPDMVSHYGDNKMLISEFVDFFNDYKEVKKNYINLQNSLEEKNDENKEPLKVPKI